MLHATMKIVHRFKLSDMRLQGNTHVEAYGEANARGDLTVMVAAVIPLPDEDTSGGTPRGFLRVWDGTGVPKSDTLPMSTAAALESITTGDPPSAALVKIAEIIKKLQVMRQNPDLQPPKALSGRVANVAIWEKQHWDLIKDNFVTVGCFIRLRNVQDNKMKNCDLRCLHVHDKSSFTPLPNLTYEVVHLLEEHNNRLLRNEPINPDSGILPLGAGGCLTLGPSHDRMSQHQSLRDVPFQQQQLTPSQSSGTNRVFGSYGGSCSSNGRLQDFMSAPIPSTFEGTVRISGVLPALSSLSSHGLEQICPVNTVDTSGDARFYRFGLRLEGELNPTTTLDVIVSDDRVRAGASIGQKLFGMSAPAALANRYGALYNIQKFLEEQRLWTVKVTSVAFQGSKFFLLSSLTESP